MRRRRRRGKGCLFAPVVLAILVAGGGLCAHLYLGATVTRAVEAVGTRVAGVPVEVGAASVLPWSGEGTLRNVTVGTPDGLRADHALAAPRVRLAIDLRSLVGQGPIVVRRIEVEGATISAEESSRGSAIGQVLEHVESTAASERETPTAGGRRLAVGRLVLSGAAARRGREGADAPPESVPEVAVEGIGSEGAGVEGYELALALAGALREALAAMPPGARPEPPGPPSELAEEVGRNVERAGEAARRELGGNYPD